MKEQLFSYEIGCSFFGKTMRKDYRKGYKEGFDGIKKEHNPV